MKLTKLPLFHAFSVFFVLLTGCVTNNLEIAQWRGVNRNGIYNENNLLNEWPKDGPELLWVYEGIGKGYASPAILNNQIYVNGEEDGNSFLFAFDLEGNLIWKSPNGEEFLGSGFSSTYPGSRSTPTVINDLVYATSGMGRIACFDVETGEEKWANNIVEDLGGQESYFGYSESVIIDENKLYCFAGGGDNNILALDRFNGEIIWSSQALQDTFSYCSPVIGEIDNQKILITHSRHNLFAVNSVDGTVLASYVLEGFEYDGEHCNSPLFEDGYIYFIGNDNEGCGAVKLRINQESGYIEEVWSNKNIKNNFNGYVKVANNLYTTVKGNWLKAIDTESGIVKDSIKVSTGSIIFADNKFICYGMNGDVNLVSFNENNIELTSKFKIEHGSNHHFAHPVIKDGIMYIRHGNALLAYKVS